MEARRASALSSGALSFFASWAWVPRPKTARLKAAVVASNTYRKVNLRAFDGVVIKFLDWCNECGPFRMRLLTLSDRGLPPVQCLQFFFALDRIGIDQEARRDFGPVQNLRLLRDLAIA